MVSTTFNEPHGTVGVKFTTIVVSEHTAEVNANGPTAA